MVAITTLINPPFPWPPAKTMTGRERGVAVASPRLTNIATMTSVARVPIEAVRRARIVRTVF